MTEKEIKKTAKELFEKRTEEVLYSNPKGEFFTSKNYAELSLKEGEKLTVHKRPASTTDQEKGEITPKKTDEKPEKGTGKGKDTSKAADPSTGSETPETGKEDAPKNEDSETDPSKGTGTKPSNPKK